MYYPIIKPYAIYILFFGIALIVLACILQIHYWLQKKVQIKITRQNFGKLPYIIEFVAKNMGNNPNSIEKKIVLKCLIASKRRREVLHGYNCKCEFHLQGNDTLLEPLKPKHFIATINSANPQLLASHFRKYRFRITTGMYTMIYIASPLGKAIPYWKYIIGRSIYRVFRRVTFT